jgi:ABC-2 type transport system permease protein
MLKILKIAQREFLETVKTKLFLFSLFLAPVMVGAIVFFVSRIPKDSSGPRQPLKVVVTDMSNQLADEIDAAFARHNKANPDRRIHVQQTSPDLDRVQQVIEDQKAKLRSGSIAAYIVLDKDIVDGDGKIAFYTGRTKTSDMDTLWTVESILNRAVVDRRCRLQNISPELISQLRYVPVERFEVGSAGQERRRSNSEQAVAMMVPFAFMYLMFMGVFGTGQQMLTSIIEEKSSRVIEVLLSAVSPFELMAGKILGLAAIGLTVVSIWAIAAGSAAVAKGLSIDVTPATIVYFAAYYILGFLLFSSILAAIGSVCNTIKEAQSLMMPLTLILVFPLVAWFNLAQNPEGMLARLLSFVPPLTPMIMVLRLSASGHIPFIEVALSFLVLIAAVLLVMWAAAKIFRTGILMYGKRPGLSQIYLWLRQS